MSSPRMQAEPIREPAPIAPLSLLPVFLNLGERNVLLSGHSHAAVWKAELLLAAGAQLWLRVEASGELLDWHTANRANARVRLLPADATVPDAACWIAEADDDATAAAISLEARSQRIPLNVIDRPTYSDFQFGSIVNRSPLVLGISTSGAAPSLAQAVRQRIETLLSPALADWTSAALRARARIRLRLPQFDARRAFWRRFAQRALREEFSETALDSLLCDTGAEQRRGHVTLVGAGPGDPGLLTLNAVRALQSADVVLFDDLVSDDVLELCRREAKRMLVGKRARQPSCRQEDIGALMLGLARAGKHVVRLKGGDPGIFGRAGEEIALLRDAGIPCRIVPGITAALAMAAAFGVSLTHREQARSVQLVTGHARGGLLPEHLNWAALADPQTTTVFYMGAATASDIVERLCAHGLDPATPTVWVADLCRPGERRWRGPLSGLARSIGAHELGSPLLIGVGQVFAFAAIEVAETDSSVAGFDVACTRSRLG